MSKKILFICTSNKDRSPALATYFRSVYPQHEYRSAGVNKYSCGKNQTHYITTADLDWANVYAFAEDIHLTILLRDFNGYKAEDYTPFETKWITLNCGEYEQGNINEDYLLKAEEKLRHILK